MPFAIGVSGPASWLELIGGVTVMLGGFALTVILALLAVRIVKFALTGSAKFL